MARLVTPPPTNTAAEWGKRLAYLACVLIPVLLLVVLLLNEREARLDRLSWNDITLSATPPMGKADFLREVRAGGRFSDTLDVSDPQLFEKLREAALRHDWVQEVARVALVPPRTIHIDLAFRTPVAKLQRGLQMHLVDRFGKLLLPLTPDQGSSLVSLVGWGERNSTDTEAMGWLAQAAMLAYQLQADLGPWNIAGIYLVREVPLDMADLRLRTKNGTFIIWQTLKGPAQEEPSLIEKQSRLRVYQERYGSLEVPAGQLLDVRVKELMQRRPSGQ
ncbi:MAG TPA: hypothetical protein PLN21_19380 [Gemmatales bacterium]|nr:hypothetical protein [Gemmatales bacterium]